MKKIIVIALAVVLCLSIVGTVLAFYAVTPDDLTINIVTGGKAHLTISSIANGTIKPGTTITRNITLDDTAEETLEGEAILTVEIADVSNGALAQYLDVTFIEADNDNGTFTAKQGASTVSEATLTSTGVSFEMDNLPDYGILTISISCTDEQFKAVSEDQVTITLSFDYVEWAPVANAYYIIGDFNGWKLDSTAIILDDTPVNGNSCQKEGVTLAAGNFKIIQYVNPANIWENQWPLNDNYYLATGGVKNIYLNNNYITVNDAQ